MLYLDPRLAHVDLCASSSQGQYLSPPQYLAAPPPSSHSHDHGHLYNEHVQLEPSISRQDPAPQRKRPKYTRSKTGCLTCRQKKIKVCNDASSRIPPAHVSPRSATKVNQSVKDVPTQHARFVVSSPNTSPPQIHAVYMARGHACQAKVAPTTERVHGRHTFHRVLFSIRRVEPFVAPCLPAASSSFIASLRFPC